MSHKYSSCIAAVFLVCFSTYAQEVSTIFGNLDEQNPIAIKLLNHDVLHRLKYIDQSGPNIYISDDCPEYSRYDHSLGVYALLKRYKVSIEEQMAGLMHDTSHTVFSHLADYILQGPAEHINSYQDTIYDSFLTQFGIHKILSEYNLTLQDISPKNPKFTALEQELPDMNADRIEYNLHTALLFKDLEMTEIEQILAVLHFENSQWYFTDLIQAKKFAKLSTYYTRNFWGGHKNAATYSITGSMLKYAIKNHIVTSQEFHTGTDLLVINKLRDSNDAIIQSMFKILNKIEEHYIVVSKNDFDVHFQVKMRGIDPLVLSNNNLKRLSKICVNFKQELQITSELAKHGVYLKFINIDNPEILKSLKA